MKKMKLSTSQTSKTTKQQMVDLCRRKKWKGYSRLDKRKLQVFIDRNHVLEQRALDIINRAIRKWVHKFKSSRIVNTEDIFTTDEIPKAMLFTLRGDKNNVYQFHVQSLLKYVLTEGKFINPFTMAELTDIDLRRLKKRFFESLGSTDELPKYTLKGRERTFTDCTNLCEIRKMLRIEKHAEYQRQELLDYLHNMVCQTLDTILDIIQNVSNNDLDSITSVFIYALYYHLPKFLEYLMDFIDASEVEGRQFFKETVITIAGMINEMSTTCIKAEILSCVFKVLDHKYEETFGTPIHSPAITVARNFRCQRLRHLE